jgi:hypothetical protein
VKAFEGFHTNTLNFNLLNTHFIYNFQGSDAEEKFRLIATAVEVNKYMKE